VEALPLSRGASRDEAARLRRELHALHETAAALSGSLDRASLLEHVVDGAAELIHGAHGFLYLLEDDGPRLVVRIARGPLAPFVGSEVRPGVGVAGRVWETGEACLENDYRGSARPVHVGDDAPRAVIGVPLTSRGGLVGVIGVATNDVRGLGRDDLEMVERFARLASLALERDRLRADLESELTERRRAEDELVDTVARLTASGVELRRSQEEMVRRLAAAAESRDASTGRHVERMSETCELIARQLGLDEAFCEAIRAAAALHDIGKIGVPDAVLLKPGPLTDAEREQMEQHTETGYRILSGSGSELLDLAASIALTHHERFDGTGYPHGRAGDAIPVEGRIAAVADVYDALTSDRVYRHAFPVETALEILRQGSGTQFDPVVLEAFLAAHGHVPTTARPSLALPAAAGGGDEHVPSRDGILPADAVANGVTAALAHLGEGGDPRHAIDAALARFCDGAGRGVVASVYVLTHDRLWCLAQHGYEQVRDGFEVGSGVMARCLAEGRVQFVPDVRLDPDFIAAVPGIVSELTVPIHAERASAVLNVETLGVGLSHASAEPVTRLAEGLARYVDELGGARFDVSTLLHMAVYASTLRGVPALAEFAVRTLGRLLDLKAAQLDLGAHPTGAPASFWRRDASGLRPLPADWVHQTGGRLGLAGISSSTVDGWEVGVPDDDPEARWLLWLPLVVGGDHVGTLIGRAAEPLDLQRGRAEAAVLFAQHIAALLDVAQALRRERRAAVTDPLTGLLNRRGFDERLREELDRAQRTERPLALVLADCDDLKRINDAGGHELGDAVLQAVARVIRECKRSSDVAARLGGDEFGLVLPDADGSAALDMAERLRRGLATLTVGSEAPSASFGFAVFPTHADTGAELLRVADRALYAAKRAGKGRPAGGSATVG
jgi:diguanylate cyclase (GGDEF)-like protein